MLIWQKYIGKEKKGRWVANINKMKGNNKRKKKMKEMYLKNGPQFILKPSTQCTKIRKNSANNTYVCF